MSNTHMCICMVLCVFAGVGGGLVGDRHQEQTCGSAAGMFWLPRVTQTAALCGFSHARKLKSLQSRQEKKGHVCVCVCHTLPHKQFNISHKEGSYSDIKVEY